MVRLFIQSLFIVFSFLFVSCSQDEVNGPGTIEYFQAHLKAGMSERTVFRRFGKPDMDLGHGIHIYVYQLSDSTEVWIGCTDQVLYANQFDKNQNHLKVLI
jgi:hypothetical protein